MTIFDEIHRTIAMQPETSDELAILAKDARALSKDERELIHRAAEELRQCYRCISRVMADFHEASAQRFAAREQLSELRHKLDALEQKVRAKPVEPDTKPPAVTWTMLLSGPLALNGPLYGKAFGS